MISEQSFYQVFEVSPVPTVILTGNYPYIDIAEANQAYASLTGRAKEELIGSTFLRNTSYPSMQMEERGFRDVQESIEKVMRDKVTVKTPVQKFSKPIPGTHDFQTLYLEAVNTPVFTENKEIKYIIRCLQDVTEAIVTQQKERSKDALLRESQKAGRIGSWEIYNNSKVRWSDVQYDIFELKTGQELTVTDGNRFLKGEKDRQIFWGVYDKAVETGEYFDVELEVITAKGNERWVRIAGKGEIKEGKFERVYGVTRDITDLKRIEQELIDSRNRLEDLIQTVEGVVWEANYETFNLTFVSDQVTRMLGYTAEECLSEPGFWTNRLHPDDRETVLAYSLEKIEADENYTIDYRIRKKDGTYAWTKVSASVISEHGNPKWLRGLMLDITPSKRLQQLEHLEKKVLELNANPTEPIEKVLQVYLQGIEAIFPEMHCAIMRAKNNRLFNWVAGSLSPTYQTTIDNLPITAKSGSCGTAAHLKEKVIVSDIAASPLWETYKAPALENNLRACWSYPIIDSAGKVKATLGMYYNTVKAPTPEELKVIERTATLLKIIIEHRENVELLEDTNFLMKQSQELAHFGSVQFDVETQELTWSDELFAIFGLDKNNVKPTSDIYLQAIHPDDRAQVEQHVENMLQAEQDYIFEERIIRPNGEVRYLKTWGRVKANEKGDVVKVIAAYMDITDHKNTEAELIASEARLRSIVDSQTNYVIRTDLYGNYTFMNKKYKQDFGLSLVESLQHTNSIFSVVPAQHDEMRKVIANAIANPNEIFQIELDKFTSTGNIKSSYWHFICLTNNKGEPSEFQCIGIDITDRKRAEEERQIQALQLAESEKRYSDLFHLSPQPMWVYDLDTLRFLDVNMAAIVQYGYTREEFLAMTIKDIRPPEEVDKLLEATNLSQKIFNRIGQGIYTHRQKNGEIIHVEIRSRHIPVKGERARLVLATNITERLKYFKALESQNEKLREIAWIQSHVVRAPVARIMGLINLIKNYSDPDLDQEQVLRYILDSAYELDDVIRDIVRKAEQVQLDN